MNTPTAATLVAPFPTLATVLWRGRAHGQLHPLRQLALAAAGSALLALAAKVQIPFYPVPLTMQTFVVLALGMAFGCKLGALTVLLYLAEGAAGLPVFAGAPAKGAGLAYMLGPTGGYLLGFVAAAAACGFLAERGWDRRASTTFAAMLAGNLLIYACGIAWLGTVVGWDKPVLALGLYPFLPGDALKIALAVVALPGAWKALNR
ncbi:MAG: biotin transporter BioY [Gammaproteobacteria bacterium]|nr:biotin transporter BioY [Gammaproteobacteria bacterium]